jgi:hypothetical protein
VLGQLIEDDGNHRVQDDTPNNAGEAWPSSLSHSWGIVHTFDLPLINNGIVSVQRRAARRPWNFSCDLRTFGNLRLRTEAGALNELANS